MTIMQGVIIQIVEKVYAYVPTYVILFSIL